MKKIEKVKKFRRHHNTRIIKHKQTYSTEEISLLLNVHPQTVGTWHKSGLKKIDNNQPYLVFGQDLINFINSKNNSRKHPCAPNELFCCKCQRPSKPRDNSVCINVTRARTNILGSCETCGTKINKTIPPLKINSYKKIFIVQTVHEEDLIECANTSAIAIKNKKEIRG